MREFLHSEISQITNTPNIPHHPDIALHNGKILCQKILEPIQDHFGRIFVRSGYRSPEINALGAANRNKYRCSSNNANYARHIWDYSDSKGGFGAMACIVIPSYLDHYEKTGDWETLSNWIHSNIDYSEMTFFPKLCAFNISWHQKPQRKVRSYIK